MKTAWEAREDIFLTGVVLDMYYRRHSLPEDEESGKVWKRIHQRYETANRRYELLYGKKAPKRTVEELLERWKDTVRESDIEVDSEGCFVEPTPLTTKYEQLWDRKYNVGCILTCPETQFQILLTTKDRKMIA